MAQSVLRFVLFVSLAQLLQASSHHHSLRSHSRLVKRLARANRSDIHEYLYNRASPARVHLHERATPVLPSGWSYQACVREPSSGRTLTGMLFNPYLDS